MKEKEIKTMTLKKKWFDMILSGEKKEEYREIKPYWVRRLIGEYQSYNESSIFYRGGDYMMPFGINKIRFKNGYSKNCPSFVIEWKGVSVGCPKRSWCPEETDLTKFVFILSLGEIVTTLNKSQTELYKKINQQ